MLGLGSVDEGHERLDHLIRLCGRFPVLGRNDGQTDLSLLVHVRVIDARAERDARRLERILGRKFDRDPERALSRECE